MQAFESNKYLSYILAIQQFALQNPQLGIMLFHVYFSYSTQLQILLPLKEKSFLYSDQMKAESEKDLFLRYARRLENHQNE